MAEKNETTVAKKNSDTLAAKTKQALVPPVDIYEDGEAVTLYADLPGISKEDLDLQIEKDNLQIYAKVKNPPLEHTQQHYTEFPLRDYYRAFTIGDEIDKDKISASMNNGVLKLVLPKSERVKPKKIDIQVS